MASEIERIMSWFYRQVFPQGILEFDEALAEAVISTLSKSPIDTERYVHVNGKRHWNALMQRLDDDKKLGRSPLLQIEDMMSRRFSWVPRNISAIGSAREKQKAHRLSSRPLILQMIDDLTDREYEALGCVISKMIGASHTLLTHRGNEGGVDFFALINIPAKCHVFGGYCRPLRVIGQAKKYQGKVQVDEIRELITTIQDIQYRNPTIEPLVPTWFRTAHGLLVGWLIAHNGVQSGGVNRARNHGIIISDSIDLAEIAALSRGINDTGLHYTRPSLVKQRVDSTLINSAS